MKRTIENYIDIINLPRHISQKHPHMSIHDRAAQFAPFAALTGHGEAISETARTVDSRIVLGEDAATEIANTLNFIQLNIKNELNISVTYFVADNKKCGGKYISSKGTVKNINNIDKTLVFMDNVCIDFDDIYEIYII